MTINDVYEFVEKLDVAVVSTVNSDGAPEAGVVEFAQDKDLTIFVDMFNTSRKYKNLQTNQAVAIVIGLNSDITIQINAFAHELVGNELETVKQIYFLKNEKAKKWGNRPDIAYFAFKPTWIRYTDVGRSPWFIQEFNIATS